MKHEKLICIQGEGSPMGRPVNSEHLRLSGYAWQKEIQARINREFESFVADENTFAFPEGEVGREYSVDEVELIWQYCHFGIWKNCSEKAAIKFYSGFSTRQIYRLKPHLKHLDNCINAVDRAIAEIDKRRQKPEETAEEAEKIRQADEHIRNPYFPKRRESFIDGWEAAMKWQKQKEGK